MTTEARWDAETLEMLASGVEHSRESCEATFLGGYRAARDIEIFRHGMDTVHNVYASVFRRLRDAAKSAPPTLDKPTLRHVADMIVALMKGQIDVRELRPEHAKDWPGVRVDDALALVERMERDA